MVRQRATPAERRRLAKRLGAVEAYGKPRRVWVDDGHVFVEGHDGTIVSMTPEVAIEFGRLIGNAGAESLVNKIMDPHDDGDGGASPASPPSRVTTK